MVIGIWGSGSYMYPSRESSAEVRRKNYKCSHPTRALCDPEFLSVNTSSRQGSREGLAGEILQVVSGTDGRVGFLQWELGLVGLACIASDKEGAPGHLSRLRG